MNNKLKNITKVGKVVGLVLKELKKEIKVGVSGIFLEEKAKKMMHDNKVESSVFNYRDFPSYICVSVSNEKESQLTHGIPNDIPFKNGDLVSIDVACFLRDENGLAYHADAAITVLVGDKDEKKERLISVTRDCLYNVVNSIVPNKTTVNDIGKTIESFVKKNGYWVIKEYGGHSIGHNLHESPFIPNFFEKDKKKYILKTGMFICIEPLVQENDNEVVEKKVLTDKGKEREIVISKNGFLNAHFEHTIYIGDEKAVIITE